MAAKKLTPAAVVILGGALVVFVGSFLPYFSLGDASVNAWTITYSPVTILPVVFGAAMAAHIGLATGGATSRSRPGSRGFTWNQFHIALGVQAAVMMVAWFVCRRPPGFTLGLGFWLMLLASVALADRRDSCGRGIPRPRTDLTLSDQWGRSWKARRHGSARGCSNGTPTGPEHRSPMRWPPVAAWCSRPASRSIAADIAIGDGSDFEGELGAFVFLALAIVGFVALLFLPAATHPAFVAANVISVPAFFGLLLLPETDSFTDVRLFIVLTILGWTFCFFTPGVRGRPIFVALAALLLFFWVIGEVSDVDDVFQRRARAVADVRVAGRVVRRAAGRQ